MPEKGGKDMNVGQYVTRDQRDKKKGIICELEQIQSD